MEKDWIAPRPTKPLAGSCLTARPRLRYAGGMKIPIIIFTFFLVPTGFATETSPWLTDWPAAQKIARLEKKPIFAVLY